MNTLQGKVVQFSKGTTKTGQKFWTVTLATGQKLTTFEWNYLRGIERGNTVKFPVTVSAQGYINIVGQGKVATSASVPLPLNKEDFDAGDVGVWGDQAETPPDEEDPDIESPDPWEAELDTPPEKEKVWIDPNKAKEISIIRQSTLKVAATFLNGTKSSVDALLSLAKRLEQYVESGK